MRPGGLALGWSLAVVPSLVLLQLRCRLSRLPRPAVHSAGRGLVRRPSSRDASAGRACCGVGRAARVHALLAGFSAAGRAAPCYRLLAVICHVADVAGLDAEHGGDLADE